MACVDILEDVTPERFATEIRQNARPVVLRGIAKDWPAVRHALCSDREAAEYIKSFDNGAPAKTVLGPPAIKGAFFYGATTSSFNFQSGAVPISLAIDRLFEQRDSAEPFSIYVQSSLIRAHLPAFADENRLSLVAETVDPRIWIGNAVRVQTHYDLSENLAVVVAGTRRFTLFPPEQLGNLYIGPFNKTIAGTPISMASLDEPDFEQYPRLRGALEHAQVADLEPGDALYIPYFWWHHVRSMGSFNVLVNYWWNDGPGSADSAYDSLVHAILSIHTLPPVYRRGWKAMFDYFVFESHGDPVSHLALSDKGPLGSLTEVQTMEMWRQLAERLSGRQC